MKLFLFLCYLVVALVASASAVIQSSSHASSLAVAERRASEEASSTTEDLSPVQSPAASPRESEPQGDEFLGDEPQGDEEQGVEGDGFGGDGGGDGADESASEPAIDPAEGGGGDFGGGDESTPVPAPLADAVQEPPTAEEMSQATEEAASSAEEGGGEGEGGIDESAEVPGEAPTAEGNGDTTPTSGEEGQEEINPPDEEGGAPMTPGESGTESETPAPAPTSGENGGDGPTPTTGEAAPTAEEVPTTDYGEGGEERPVATGEFDTPVPAPVGFPTFPPVERPTFPFSTPVYIPPTPRPESTYVSTDDDPLTQDVVGDDTYKIETDWNWNQSTIDDMEHDKSVVIALSVVFGVMFLFSIVVAHQMLHNPQGCCARYDSRVHGQTVGFFLPFILCRSHAFFTWTVIAFVESQSPACALLSDVSATPVAPCVAALANVVLII